MKFHTLSKFNIRFDRKCICTFTLVGLIVLMAIGETHAQRRSSALGKKDEAKKAQPNPSQNGNATPANRNQPGGLSARPNANQRGKKVDEFAPQIVTMEVKGEAIQLVATWFPPRIEKDKKKKGATPNRNNGANKSADKKEDVEKGKSTSPFILVHEWGRSRTDMLALAFFLQSNGHAVIVPDLRGHGASIHVRGSTKTLDHETFKTAQESSAVGDIDQCKRFLQEKNNEGLVNIDLLNIIAVGDSCHLAVNWAMADWTWGPVAGIKQGKDVKSMILFSPSKKFAGSALKKLTKLPLISGRNAAPLPMLVIWGGKSEAAKGCNDFVDSLRKFRPEAPEEDDAARVWFKQNLFHFEEPGDFEGYILAGNPRAKKIWAFANDFVSQKVLNFKDQFPWQIRGKEAVLKAREEAEK